MFNQQHHRNKTSQNTSASPTGGQPIPDALTMADLLDLNIPEPESLIENILPRRGACLITGSQKSGKTVLATQMAVAVALGKALFDYYRVLFPGAVMVVEQDDPSGDATIKQIVTRSRVPRDAPFHFHRAAPYPFGPAFTAWMEHEISRYSLAFAVLDSYTCMRPFRPSGIDIVRAEHTEMTTLDELGKRTNCLVSVVHHESKGSSSLDWSARGGGTFAMTMGVESQISISRYADLAINAPERLVRVLGRHLRPVEFVLKFREESSDYEHVLEGGAAALYPTLLLINEAFSNQTFSPKELCRPPV